MDKEQLIDEARQHVGESYRIDEACWCGTHWSSEYGKITPEGVRRYFSFNDDDGVLDTWDEIDEDILQDVLDNLDDEE